MNSKEDPGGQSFMDYLADNYDDLKTGLIRICKSFNDILFDEDIFHDTIIKVNDVIDTKHFSKEVYDKYMCKSFRTNLVRDKLYHRNSMTNHTFDFEGMEPYSYSYVESTIDFGMVLKILGEKFGTALTRAYVNWLSGFPIKELDIDSPYYHIREMTNYIRSYCMNGKIIY